MRPPWQSRGGPATPFPWRAAETVASPRQMEPPALPVSLPPAKKEVERVLEVGLAPAPITDARRRAEALARPCWEGAGPEQVQSQPLDPPLSAPQWCFLPVLAPSHSHTREVLGGLLPAPTFNQQQLQTPKIQSRPCVVPSKRKEKTLKVAS